VYLDVPIADTDYIVGRQLLLYWWLNLISLFTVIVEASLQI
jgi:hypothetical protein